jgi:hypothetical protein
MTFRTSSITNATASRLNSSVNERRDLTGSSSITDVATSLIEVAGQEGDAQANLSASMPGPNRA